MLSRFIFIGLTTINFLFFGLLSGSLSGCTNPQYSDGAVNTESLFANPNCDFQFSKSGLCLNWAWTNKPIDTTSKGTLVFRTYKNENGILYLNELSKIPKVSLWMPSMGHGSSPTTTTQLSFATYQTQGVVFIMAGEWQIKFQILDNNNAIVDEAIIPIIR